VSLGRADAKIAEALGQGKSPADAPDKVLVPASCDCTVRKQTNTILAISQEIETSSSGGAKRSGREDSLYGMEKGCALRAPVLWVGREAPPLIFVSDD